MPKLKLTKTNIDRVRKPGTGTVIYVDTETKGFGLRVTASGAASFVVQGMIAGQSKEARITIGTYGAWTVDDARRRAEEYKHQFEDGIDPREVKKQDEAMKVTLRQVADAYFDRPGQPLRDSTKAEMNRHIDRVFAKWADKAIASITVADCRQRHREMCESGIDGRPAPGQAQISLVTLRTLINFANRRYSDIRNTGRFKPICDAVASMDDQQRGDMRQVVVTTACEVMRDCDNPEIRADMFDVLRQLKVIHHES